MANDQHQHVNIQILHLTADDSAPRQNRATVRTKIIIINCFDEWQQLTVCADEYLYNEKKNTDSLPAGNGERESKECIGFAPRTNVSSVDNRYHPINVWR
jgi:hypothetical protein